MRFLKTMLKQVATGIKPVADQPIVASKRPAGTKQRGEQAEALACAFLQQQGLRLLARNYRSPGRGGGEIDLVMQERDGTLVFVEVRLRQRADFGGAAASVDRRKQAKIVLAAQHFLLSQRGAEPPCRFDVVVLQGPPLAGMAAKPATAMAGLEWIKAAFDAG